VTLLDVISECDDRLAENLGAGPADEDPVSIAGSASRVKDASSSPDRRSSTHSAR